MATEYGKRLKKAMAHAKLNQKGLIAATGLKQSTVSSAMNRSVGSSDTPAYAAACGVSALWLATGEGEMLIPTGEHKQNPPIALVDTGVTATNTVAEKQLSVFALAIGRLFDQLTDRQKSKLFGEITGTISDELNPPKSAPSKRPKSVANRGKQHA